MATPRAKSYREIFFTWGVPGVILVAVGTLIGHPALPSFGMALLSLGLVQYGRLKGYQRSWFAIWLLLAVVYLALGLAELWKGIAA